MNEPSKQRRPAPRSLPWRLGALALLVTGISLVLHVTIIAMVMRPMTDYLLVGLSARVLMTKSVLAATSEGQRDAVATVHSDSRFTIARNAGSSMPLAQDVFLPLADRLRPSLGSNFVVLHEVSDDCCFGERAIVIAFRVDEETWSVRVLAQPPFLALLGTVFGWLVVAGLAVGGSFAVGSRFIVGPLRTVSSTMAQQESSLTPLAAPSGSSAEVYSLVESFNRLAERVQASDRTKQQLLAGVSHDLRTPLSRLRLRIETQCPPQVAEEAEEELRAVEHIVSQFLSYVQGDRGAGFGPQQPLVSTCRQVVSAFRSVGVDVDLVAFSQDAYADAVGLQRLLTNLVDNAVAYGAQPIEVTWRFAAAGWGELAVWDNGKGLSDQDFAKARAPFVRLSKEPEIGNCGLGLAIVEQIAHLWQGSLSTKRDSTGRFAVVVTWPLTQPQQVVDATLERSQSTPLSSDHI